MKVFDFINSIKRSLGFNNKEVIADGNSLSISTKLENAIIENKSISKNIEDLLVDVKDRINNLSNNIIKEQHVIIKRKRGAKKMSREEALETMIKKRPEYDFKNFVYEDNKTPSFITCSAGHVFKMSRYNIIAGRGCPDCNYRKISSFIKRYLSTIYKYDIITSRDLIKSKRDNKFIKLDVYLERIKFAVFVKNISQYGHLNKYGFNTEEAFLKHLKSQCLIKGIELVIVDKHSYITNKDKEHKRIISRLHDHLLKFKK